MLTLLALLYGMFGLVTRSMAPLVTPILRDLRISYSEMGLILGSWQLTFMCGSIFSGMLIDRWGLRKSILLGGLICAVSVGLRSLPTSFTGMLLAVTLLGAGFPAIAIGCPKAISIWFKGKEKARAVGIYLCGNFTGQLSSLALTNSLVMPLLGYSWRLTFLCYGLFCAGITLAWWGFGKETSSSGEGASPGIARTFWTLCRIRNVQILLMMGLLTFTTIHAFNHWLPKIMEASGMSPDIAGFISAIPVASGIPSLLIIPSLISTEGRPRFIAFAAFFTILTLVGIVVTSGILQIAALIIYGILQASFVPILTLLLMETPEIESQFLGTATGLFFCVAEFGGFSGPLIMGILVDVTGTFLAGTLFCAFLNLIIVFLTFPLRVKGAVRNPYQG